MLPVLVDAVVPVYRINGLKVGDPPLVLDRDTLAQIFLGKIRRWDDGSILKHNPELASVLQGKHITVAYLSGVSGMTEILTSALSAFSPEWRDGPGTCV